MASVGSRKRTRNGDVKHNTELEDDASSAKRAVSTLVNLNLVSLLAHLEQMPKNLCSHELVVIIAVGVVVVQHHCLWMLLLATGLITCRHRYPSIS